MCKVSKLFMVFALCLGIYVAPARADDFTTAAQLLRAARAGDTTTVAQLVANGANVNYVDNTGLSIVCTAIMNNDMTAAKILQTYGADASRCDAQIKQFRAAAGASSDSGGILSGLSNPQRIALYAAGAAAVVGIVWYATTLFDGGNGHDNNSGDGTRPGGDNGGGTNLGGTATVWADGALPLGPNEAKPSYNFSDELDMYSPNNSADELTVRDQDWAFMSGRDAATGDLIAPRQNYLLLMHGYAPLARGYMGQLTWRDKTTNAPLNITSDQFTIQYPPSGVGDISTANVTGGQPIAVALITNNGINPTGSATDGFIGWSNLAGVDATTGKYYGYVTRKYANVNAETLDEENADTYDLSGHGTVFNEDADDDDTNAAKVIAGWEGGDGDARTDGDYYGFMPNGQLVIYRTGGGTDAEGNEMDYRNFEAMRGAVNNSSASVVANVAVPDMMYDYGAPNVAGMSMQFDDVDSRANQQMFAQLLNNVYDRVSDDDTVDTNQQGDYADALFQNPHDKMLIFGTGGYYIGTQTKNDDGTIVNNIEHSDVQSATLENYAPALYDGTLEHLFMSVVAVQSEGTAGATNVSGWDNSSAGKISLATWTDADGNLYGARECGMTGAGGAGSIDPWCFAAAGANDKMAVASMAGAVGVVQSAFSYMTNQEIFTLLALTSDGRALTTDELRDMYDMRGTGINENSSDNDFLQEFAERYGYGLINLDRATTANSSVYYYDANKINSDAGNAVWSETGTAPSGTTSGGTGGTSPRVSTASANMIAATKFSASGALGGLSGKTINAPMFDFVSSADGTMSMPRIYGNSITLGGGRRGTNMLSAMSDFTVDSARDVPSAHDGMAVNFSLRDDAQYNDGYGNINKLDLRFNSGNWSFGANYQNHFGAADIVRGDADNPLFSLASNAASVNTTYRFGNWSFGTRAVVGNVNDDELLQSDPITSNMYQPARLGGIGGIESGATYKLGRFAFGADAGFMNETGTILGAYSGGLFGLGGGDTTYMDGKMSVKIVDDFRINARYTMANTHANPNGGMIAGMSDLTSDAYSVGATWGGWSFNISRPLAVTAGTLSYATADLSTTPSDTGYDLVANPYIANINMAATHRETRFSLAYRTALGPATDGAIGFVYRENPDNTNAFGNEAVLMFKINHRLGI